MIYKKDKMSVDFWSSIRIIASAGQKVHTHFVLFKLHKFKTGGKLAQDILSNTKYRDSQKY